MRTTSFLSLVKPHAGAVACFSVSQGQNIFVAIGVTAFATTVALIADRLFFN